MTFTAIPSVEKVGESIVPKTSDVARDRQTQQSSDPRIPRRAPPDLNCTVGAYE
jgi:ArsR family transcriptional regulator